MACSGFRRGSTATNRSTTRPILLAMNTTSLARTHNHYGFDLNRDWLVARQPESKGRVALFQEWKPNVFTGPTTKWDQTRRSFSARRSKQGEPYNACKKSGVDR